ncbi:hypothetical protein J5N97_021750 [Dioscorea zingiberensis]|uniref:KEN domain-containing protein n=1 Tax=Dioscorea zingiberensis TaxID=325984 RepID=A0A9D5C9W4_9LILI|nr:hypothetical protein J5N97_021750 [Dioscorea zingiberensis]
MLTQIRGQVQLEYYIILSSGALKCGFHFSEMELPKELQEILGPLPEGFDNYFSKRFPNLLIEVYNVASNYCTEEDCFQKYFESSML